MVGRAAAGMGCACCRCLCALCGGAGLPLLVALARDGLRRFCGRFYFLFLPFPLLVWVVVRFGAAVLGGWGSDSVRLFCCALPAVLALLGAGAWVSPCRFSLFYFGRICSAGRWVCLVLAHGWAVACGGVGVFLCGLGVAWAGLFLTTGGAGWSGSFSVW